MFERNAYFTAFKNYDAELWPQLMPAVQLTLLARTQHLLARCNPNGEVLAQDPFRSDADGGGTASGDRGAVSRADAGAAPRGLWQRARDVVALRTRLRGLARRLGGLPAGAPAVVDDQTVAQVRALSAIVRGLDGASGRRRLVQARRRRPDREILERFPLYLVPTYPGDEQLFASEGFQSLWPEDLDPVRLRLADVMEVER